MPQSSRSRHQRTRFPGPHGVATAATASQTATSEWIRQHPVAACDSCAPGYMLHGCFMISPRPWWPGCVRVGGHIQSPDKGIDTNCASPKNPFRRWNHHRMTHWPLEVLATPGGVRLSLMGLEPIWGVCVPPWRCRCAEHARKTTIKKRKSLVSGNWKMLKMQFEHKISTLKF